MNTNHRTELVSYTSNSHWPIYDSLQHWRCHMQCTTLFMVKDLLFKSLNNLASKKEFTLEKQLLYCSKNEQGNNCNKFNPVWQSTVPDMVGINYCQGLDFLSFLG